MIITGDCTSDYGPVEGEAGRAPKGTRLGTQGILKRFGLGLWEPAFGLVAMIVGIQAVRCR